MRMWIGFAIEMLL